MVVIEIIGAEGKTPRFERPEQSVIRFGRALDNDVIIDDPYVDAHHLVLDVTDPENWHARDLDSANGTFKARHAVESAAVASGDELLIGKTRIRMFSVGHQVPAARSLKDLEHRLLSFDSIPVMILQMLVLAAVPCVTLYLNSYGNDIKPDAFVVASTSLLGGSLVVAAFWSLIARLMRGEARFRVLFNITMLSGLLSALLHPLIGAIAYNFPGGGLDDVASLLMSALVGAVYVYIVLLLSTRLSSRLSQAVAVLVATGTIGTYAITQYSGRDDFQPYPRYDGAVYAPAFLVRSGESPGAFRARLPDVFTRADKLAVEETDEGE